MDDSNTNKLRSVDLHKDPPNSLNLNVADGGVFHQRLDEDTQKGKKEAFYLISFIARYKINLFSFFFYF